MKKYFPSKLANVLLNSIEDEDRKTMTRLCAEDIYSVMRDHEGADFKIAMQIADANRKKDAEQENIAKRIGDLEDSANYWSNRCDELQETIIALSQQLAEKKEVQNNLVPTTGIVPISDETLDLIGIDLDDDDKYGRDVLVIDSDGLLLVEGRQYYVGKADKTKMADGNMSHRIQIGGIRGKDVFGYYVDDDGTVIDQIVHLDDAPGRYIFCRSNE